MPQRAPPTQLQLKPCHTRDMSSPLHPPSTELTVPPFKPVFRSINITDPCYVDPTADACKTFARAHGGGWVGGWVGV